MGRLIKDIEKYSTEPTGKLEELFEEQAVKRKARFEFLFWFEEIKGEVERNFEN